MFVPQVLLMVEPKHLWALPVEHHFPAAVQTLWWASAQVAHPVCASSVGSQQKERLKGSDREGIDNPCTSYTWYGPFQVAYSILETQEYTRSSSPVKLLSQSWGFFTQK